MLATAWCDVVRSLPFLCGWTGIALVLLELFSKEWLKNDRATRVVDVNHSAPSSNVTV